jgi:predicted TIM-barrel fold metal-dependent hydrolase
MESQCPHSPDVLARETSDGGFSRGWAFHAKPVPAHFFDCHVHYNGGRKNTLLENIAGDAHRQAAQGIKGVMLITQVYGKRWSPVMPAASVMDRFPYFTLPELEKRLAGFNASPHRFAVYLNYHSPEADLAEAVARLGACCIKLHNAPVIEDNASPNLWLGGDWQRVFEAIQKRGMAVLFHVSQRLTKAAYLGGGENTYWAKGWANGTAFTNEDLLQAFLTCCKRFPGINFIGAHQLHLGWERLRELFALYPNLYVDSTVGCQLHLYDDFYEQDKKPLREIFIRHGDRILFGTDTFWGKNENNTEMDDIYKRHIRFVMKLDLPQDTLDKICHANAERILGGL